jgi:endonuclease YncB( thermonuclease family)
MLRVLVFVVFMGFALFAQAGQQTYGDVKVSRVTTIYDGDTFTATIDSWPGIAGKNIGIRIYGIDTPEMRGKCKREIELARLAKKKTVAMIRSAKIIELKQMRRDKYFRIDAEVFADGRSIGLALISAGLAMQYYGDKKATWC